MHVRSVGGGGGGSDDHYQLLIDKLSVNGADLISTDHQTVEVTVICCEYRYDWSIICTFQGVGRNCTDLIFNVFSLSHMTLKQ